MEKNNLSENEIIVRVCEKLWGIPYNKKFVNFFKGENICELFEKFLVLNRDYNLILTGKPIIVYDNYLKHTKRGVEFTLGIFNLNKQIGYESGQDFNKVVTVAVAQALEILPQAICKGKEEKDVVSNM